MNFANFVSLGWQGRKETWNQSVYASEKFGGKKLLSSLGRRGDVEASEKFGAKFGRQKSE